MLAFLAITLNMLFIPRYGINGAAIATLISITLYSLAKLLFVVFKMKLYPFTNQTLVSFGISLVSFFVFYYWSFPFHPIISILLKSILVVLFYLFLNYKLKVSEDINTVIGKTFKLIGLAIK